MKKLSLIVLCVFLLLIKVSTSQAESVAIASQGKCVCMDLTNPATADTVQTDSRLKTRSSTNTNYKSWLQFDLNAVYAANPDMKGHIKSAMLTFTGTADNTQAKPYVVNGLNDAAGMENWNPANLTWNNAPGNNIADSYLDPSVTTANLYSGIIQPGDGVMDSHSSTALVSFLNTDNDGLVTFIMTPGWTAYFYNAGSIHPPTLKLSMTPGAYDKTYFVATDGNDNNDGSIDHPFASIPKAVSLVSEGDAIYLRGGTHNYSATITISLSGASGNLNTLQNYQDETVVLDFSAQPYESGYKGINLKASYWHFKGFTVQYTDSTGINVTGSHNIMEQLVTLHNGDTGLGLSHPASYNQVINCDSFFNYDPEENGQDADGFAAKGPTDSLPGEGLGPGNVFRGCRAWNNSDDGFDFWWAGNGVTVEDCWAWRNGENVWGDPNFTGNANGFKLGQGGGEHILIRCLAYDHPKKGFDLNRSTTDATGVTLYNCTGVNNLYGNFYFPSPTTGAIHVLRNNISYLGSVSIGGLIFNSHNTWNSGFSVSAADFASLDSTGIDGPRESDGNLPKLAFVRLSPDSLLIDAGTDVNEPYYGNAPDLGAFEYINGDCQPDGDVDWADLQCLSENWLDIDCGYCSGADFSGDGKINFYDFVIMAENWLK